ncbi:MAG TPA: type II toxin-antitoxin system VapC family toxin [Thermoanaerobaculia bacterium]|nr:type II toxin-antitoxin system VapC family toxin [Thermoanaerobaculia bacterium]
MSRGRISGDRMRYLLDTNVCVDYLNGRHPVLIERLQRARPSEVAVSMIAVAELRYGADKSGRAADNHHQLDTLLQDLAALEFDLRSAAEYGRVRNELERAGALIGPNDMLIAAQARAHDLILLTDNVTELERVDGLRIENWRREA